MAEQRTWIPAGEGVGEQETEGRREILDAEKLKNHGALYGRFLLAALPGAKIDNIIDPDNKTVEFNNLPEDFLKGRNYNPICEKFSLAERKDEWKEVPLFDDAYKQWRRQFTDFMVNIQDPQREKALRTILSNNREAKAFTVTDADTLFKEFCDGGSDINKFIGRVTTNLVSRRKIDPTYLQELLPHLQWIASGLFGKDTASQAVTRLIELESAVRNYDPLTVLNIFSKNRINTPTDDEKRVLGLLHKSFSPVPQEKRIPAQGIPVITADIPRPAPVLESDKDEEGVPRPGVPSAAEDLERQLASLRELFAVPPAPPPTEKTTESAEETEENGEISNFEDKLLRWQHGDYKIDIGKYGEGWAISCRVNNKLTDTYYGLNSDNLDVVTAALKELEYKGFEPDTADKIYQAFGKLFLENGPNDRTIFLTAVFKQLPSEIYIDGTPFKYVVKDRIIVNTQTTEFFFSTSYFIDKLPLGMVRSINIGLGKRLLEAWITNSPTPENVVNSAGPEPTETTTGRNIIRIPENITDPADFRERLNDYLIQNQHESHIALIFSPDQLKEYIASMAEGYKVRTGDITLDESKNEITIKDVQIGGMLRKVEKFNLIIKNSADGNGIVAWSDSFSDRRFAKRRLGHFMDLASNIDSAIKKGLDQQIGILNRLLWSAGKISIADGKVRVEFDRRRSRASSSGSGF